MWFTDRLCVNPVGAMPPPSIRNKKAAFGTLWTVSVGAPEVLDLSNWRQLPPRPRRPFISAVMTFWDVDAILNETVAPAQREFPEM
jgi:hypothetical protein